jgi:hypothetical protein
MIRRLLLALGALAAAGAVHAQAQEFGYKDWAGACDNTRHCEIVGYQREEAELPVTLMLARDAGGSAPVQAWLMALSGDGEAANLSIRAGNVVIQGINGALKPEQIARLLPALKKADTASVTDGKQQWELSLAGLNAALLKMDDLQGRVDTVTALARPGSKPASSVPSALPAPLLRAAPVAATRASDAALLPKLLKALPANDCQDGPGADASLRHQVVRLTGRQVLLFVECVRGAYQSSYALWLANDKPPYAPQVLPLPLPGGESDDAPMEPEFNRGVLHTYGKGRGIGDCGDATEWLWTADGFQLLSATRAPMCRGMPGGGFPLRLWTARR